VPLLRLGYRVAYRVLQAWSLATRPGVRGVKCVLRDGSGRVLFVRHHYGSRRTWELPGGGVKRGEAPRAAVAREALEELGVSDLAWREVGAEHGVWYGKSEVLTIFEAPWPGGKISPDPVEIAHLGWFTVSEPPSPVGPTTKVALRVLSGR
jgi:8-oxo-dGTP pyrophosphatase MutT (NUDIX family)